MLAQIVQQLTDVCLGFGENGKTIAGTDLSDDEETPFVIEHGRAKSAAASSKAKPGSILHEGRGQGRERLSLEWLMRRVFDRQSVGAQHQDSFDSFAGQQAPHDIS